MMEEDGGPLHKCQTPASAFSTPRSLNVLVTREYPVSLTSLPLLIQNIFQVMVQSFVALSAAFVQLALLAQVSTGVPIPCVVQTSH